MLLAIVDWLCKGIQRPVMSDVPDPCKRTHSQPDASLCRHTPVKSGSSDYDSSWAPLCAKLVVLRYVIT